MKKRDGTKIVKDTGYLPEFIIFKHLMKSEAKC